MIHNILTDVVVENFTAPTAPITAEKYLPSQVESFGDGLWYVIKQAIGQISPEISQAAGVCLSLIAIILLLTVFENFSQESGKTARLAGTVAIAVLLMRSSGSLISLAADTIQEISQYGKLLVPVMSAATASQGGGTSAMMLYAGTIVFNAVLTAFLTGVTLPLVYIFIAVSVANRAIENDMLGNVGKFIKWFMTWSLKIPVYVFTGYMTVTGVVSGSVDASAVKAAKIAISGTVPVVGSIISDASETILAGVGVAKSTAGVFGILTLLAILIGPFLKITVQYGLLKLTSALCGVVGSKESAGLIEDFSLAMGFLLATTGAICFIHMISTVCFMKGVG